MNALDQKLSQLVSEGLSNARIAKEVQQSERWVRRKLSELSGKLTAKKLQGLRGRARIIAHWRDK